MDKQKVLEAVQDLSCFGMLLFSALYVWFVEGLTMWSYVGGIGVIMLVCLIVFGVAVAFQDDPTEEGIDNE